MKYTLLSTLLLSITFIGKAQFKIKAGPELGIGISVSRPEIG